MPAAQVTAIINDLMMHQPSKSKHQKAASLIEIVTVAYEEK
jgi:hypothetical protein